MAHIKTKENKTKNPLHIASKIAKNIKIKPDSLTKNTKNFNYLVEQFVPHRVSL